MQTWQIKALKLEVSALDALSDFIWQHALCCLAGGIAFLIVLLAWVLGGGLRRRFKQLPGTVYPAIVIRLPGPPPPQPEDFDPPPNFSAPYDHDDDDWD